MTLPARIEEAIRDRAWALLAYLIWMEQTDELR